MVTGIAEGLAVSLQEGFVVVKYSRGKDRFWLNKRSDQHAAFDDAVGDAKRTWELGTFERVCVVDHAPLQSNQCPLVLWWRNRAGPQEWVTLLDEGSEQLLVPSGADGFEYPQEISFKIPASEARVAGDTIISGMRLSLNPNGSVKDVLELVWKRIWEMYRLMGLPIRICFDGLEVMSDHVALYLREQPAE
jgi:hypothetical protein